MFPRVAASLETLLAPPDVRFRGQSCTPPAKEFQRQSVVKVQK